MKRFSIQYGIGKAKYLVNFHDGIKKHDDGSDFFDVKIFSNKKTFSLFVSELVKNDYKKV
jgi:hypothetical protein